MEWAQGIDVVNGALTARVADANGKHEHLRFAELSSRGLPTTRSTQRLLERVNLAELQVVDGAEYCELFGLVHAVGLGNGHLVYQFLTARRRWVIPSLALIRAIFRPHSVLLDEVFRPHMLERVSLFDHARGTVQVTATWAPKIGNGASDPSTLLAWLWRDQSAGLLAGSVHSLAMRGVLGIAPSEVFVDLAVEGIKVGNSFYVTRCAVTRAYLSRSYAGAAEGEEEMLDFYGATLQRSEASSKLVEVAAAVLAKGGADMRTTDTEWAVLQPILRPDTRGKPLRVDLRAVWDVLLQELANGGRAMGSDVDPEVRRSLPHYRNKWRSQRSLHAALEALSVLREVA